MQQMFGPSRMGGDRIPNLYKNKYHTHDQLLYPDIICLQEVDHFADLQVKMNRRHYHGEWSSRGNSRTDGCATFYNTKKFKLVQKHFVHYNLTDPNTLRMLLTSRGTETNELFSKLHEQYPVKVCETINPDTQEREFFLPENNKGEHLLNRDNMGLILLLECLTVDHSSKKYVCVANTHLLFNPKRGDIKLLQIDLLLWELKALLEARSIPLADVGIILCGDFNCTPASKLYEYIRTGTVDISPAVSPLWRMDFSAPQSTFNGYDNPPIFVNSIQNLTSCENVYFLPSLKLPNVQLSHSLALASSYFENGSEPSFSTMHRKAKQMVDYMWYSQNSLYITRKLELPRNPISPTFTLPNRLHPSDHLLLCVEFAFAV